MPRNAGDLVGLPLRSNPALPPVPRDDVLRALCIVHLNFPKYFDQYAALVGFEIPRAITCNNSDAPFFFFFFFGIQARNCNSTPSDGQIERGGGAFSWPGGRWLWYAIGVGWNQIKENYLEPFPWKVCHLFWDLYVCLCACASVFECVCILLLGWLCALDATLFFFCLWSWRNKQPDAMAVGRFLTEINCLFLFFFFLFLFSFSFVCLLLLLWLLWRSEFQEQKTQRGEVEKNVVEHQPLGLISALYRRR